MKRFLKIIIVFLLFSCNHEENIVEEEAESIEKEMVVDSYKNTEDVEKETEVNKDESEQSEYASTANERYIWGIIEKIKEALIRNDRNTIVTMINYPLQRHYPLPDIISEKEMLEKFDQIFDEKLIQEIIESDISDVDEWGWRGVFSSGLWFAWSDRICDIQSSSFEEKLRKELIEASKQKIHPSLKEFGDVRGLFETKNYHIRIDDLRLPDHPYQIDNYRYAVWPKGTPESEMPDLILTGGTYNRPGTGVTAYIFTNGDYIYMLYLEFGGIVGGHWHNSSGYLEVYHTGYKAGGHDISISTWYDFEYYVSDRSRILREELEIVFD